ARIRLLLSALHARQGVDLLLGVRAQRAPVGEERLVEEREQQMLGRDLGVRPPPRELLRGGHRLLALDRQLVEVHQVFLSSDCAGRYTTRSRRYWRCTSSSAA